MTMTEPKLLDIPFKMGACWQGWQSPQLFYINFKQNPRESPWQKVKSLLTFTGLPICNQAEKDPKSTTKSGINIIHQELINITVFFFIQPKLYVQFYCHCPSNQWSCNSIKSSLRPSWHSHIQIFTAIIQEVSHFLQLYHCFSHECIYRISCTTWRPYTSFSSSELRPISPVHFLQSFDKLPDYNPC